MPALRADSSKIVSADDVRIDVKARLLDRRADSGPGGEMDDAFVTASRDDAVHGGRLAYIRFVDMDPVLDGTEVGPLDAGVIIIVEFVEHVHPVAGFKEPLHEV